MKSSSISRILTSFQLFTKGVMMQWRQCIHQLTSKEYVAGLIGLYKNSGAVSCVGIYFHLIKSLYHTRTQLVVI